MMYWHDGCAWFWMIPMMLFWVILLDAVVYAAVRLATTHTSTSAGSCHRCSCADVCRPTSPEARVIVEEVDHVVASRRRQLGRTGSRLFVSLAST